MNRAYFRNLLIELPRSALAARQAHGLAGLWLVFCVFVLRRMPWALHPHPRLPLRSWHEAANYLDNFILGELRLGKVEEMLREDGGEVIEVGVNVGITTRWWLGLHPALQVTGIDMMQEALDHTTGCVTELGDAERWTPIAGAVGDHAGEMEVCFDDPLEGTNSLDQTEGGQKRRVELNTLDAYLSRVEIKAPSLLKLDIEGHAAAALRGAGGLLSRVRWVVIEIHHAAELSESAASLTAAGFSLRHFHGRTMWWSRESLKS